MSHPVQPSSYYPSPGPDMTPAQPRFSQTHAAPPPRPPRLTTQGLYHSRYSESTCTLNQYPSTPPISTPAAMTGHDERMVRRASVVTTSEWKVSSGRKSVTESKTYQPPSSSFPVDPRVRRQSAIQPPMTPAFTPNSNSSYFAHTTLSPQQADPRFFGHNVLTSRTEPFVGGFVIPPPAVSGPPPEQFRDQQNQHSSPATYRQSSYYEHASYYPVAPPLVPSPVSGSPPPPTPKASASASAAAEVSAKPVKSLSKKHNDELGPGSKREIRVRSIDGFNLWIEISPKETGSSLADRIHIIASRKTKKVASVTTAAGRKIALDRRPLFEGWDDLQNFKSGEEWQVEWCESDRRLVDRFLSKVV